MKHLKLTFTVVLIALLFGAMAQGETTHRRKVKKEKTVDSATMRMVDSLIDSLSFMFSADVGIINGKMIPPTSSGRYHGSMLFRKEYVELYLSNPFSSHSNAVEYRSISRKKNRTTIDMYISGNSLGGAYIGFLTIDLEGNASLSLRQILRSGSGFFSGKIKPWPEDD